MFIHLDHLTNLEMKIIEKAVNIPDGISPEVAHVFIAPHLMYVWKLLRVLEFDTKKIADEMLRTRDKEAPDTSDSLWILYYGFHHIQPLMNQKLGKAPNYPSWDEMLKEELKEIIMRDRHLNLFKKKS